MAHWVASPPLSCTQSTGASSNRGLSRSPTTGMPCSASRRHASTYPGGTFSVRPARTSRVARVITASGFIAMISAVASMLHRWHPPGLAGGLRGTENRQPPNSIENTCQCRRSANGRSAPRYCSACESPTSTIRLTGSGSSVGQIFRSALRDEVVQVAELLRIQSSPSATNAGAGGTFSGAGNSFPSRSARAPGYSGLSAVTAYLAASWLP